MKKQILTGLLTLAMGVAAHAVPIIGNISFTGTVNLDTASADSATEVTGWHGLGTGGLPQVQGRDGDFATFVTAGDAVTFNAPWTFVSGPVSSFWTVDGFTFDLVSSYIYSQGGGSVTVNGVGTLSGHGFDPTSGSWSFTTQNPSTGSPAEFSFSASGGFVPDGGSTMVMLGAALAGLGIVRRSVKAVKK